MTDSISEALERLQLHEESAKDDPIDDILSKTAVHRQRLRDPDELKAHLEDKYLSPSQTFSTEWLNRLQQYVILDPRGCFHSPLQLLCERILTW